MRKGIVVAGCLLIAACAFGSSTNIAGNLYVNQSITHSFTDVSGVQTDEKFVSNRVWNVTEGRGDDQVEHIWSARIRLTDGAQSVYDLAGGITNRFGQVLTLTGVKWLQVNAPAANRGSVTMGNIKNSWATWLGGTNQSISIRPESTLMVMCPGTNVYGVTAGTGDILYFTNSPAWTNILDVYVGGLQ